jgi:hypothetical protein
MTLHALAGHEADFDVRSRHWQAHGVEADRKRTVMMRRLTAIAVTGFVLWLAILLG